MESLYRGKRVDNGEWIEGGIETCKCRTFIIFQLWGFTTHYDDRYLWRSVEVDTETVGQYTGLKDKNKKKIFEGDIVLNNHGYLGVIQYFPEHMAFVIWHKKGNTINFMGYDEWASVEVIGNIHDNPELLESKEVKL